MKIEFNWSIGLEDAKFTGSANVESFEEMETLIENLKVTSDIMTQNHLLSTPQE